MNLWSVVIWVFEYDVKLVRKPTFCLQTNLTPAKGHNSLFWGASLGLLAWGKKKCDFAFNVKPPPKGLTRLGASVLTYAGGFVYAC